MKLKLHSPSGVLLGGILLVGMATTAHAQDRNCAERVRQDQRELDRAMDRYGFDSSQARHERDELNRDAASCGYDRDRGYYGQQDRYNSAFDNGYRDGVAMGQRDVQRGKAYRPSKNDQYEDADHGYNKYYGDKKVYKNQYREAFERGYADGYGRNAYWR